MMNKIKKAISEGLSAKAVARALCGVLAALALFCAFGPAVHARAEEEPAQTVAAAEEAASENGGFEAFVRNNKLLLMLSFDTAIVAAVGAWFFASTVVKKTRKSTRALNFIDEKLYAKYEAIFVIDLKRNKTWAAKKSEASRMGHFSGEKDYSELARRYAEHVKPEYKQEWINFSDINYMRKYMAGQDVREYYFELQDLKLYMKLVVYVLERTGGEADTLMYSFERVSDVGAENIALQNRINEQNAFTQYFFEPYISAYYVSLKDNSFQVYKRTQKLAMNYPVSDGFVSSVTRYIYNQVAPQDRDKVLVLAKPEKIKEILSRQHSYSFTFREIGEPEDSILQCELARGADDYHYAVGFKDVTAETKSLREAQVNADLARQQRHIKAFGDMINAALWNMTLDEDNNVIAVRWSDELIKMLGFSPDEGDFPSTLGAWLLRIHPEDQQRARQHFYSGISSRNPEDFTYEIEYRYLRKNNEYCWYHLAGRMENNPDGNRTIYGIIYDISEARLLSEREQQLRAALDAANLETQRNNILYNIAKASKWTYEINAEGKITSLAYGDRARNKVIEENGENPLAWMELLHPDDREDAVAKFNRAVAEHSETTVYENTYRLRFKDGKYNWVRSSGRMLHRPDGGTEFFGMSINITEQIEQQEKQKEKLNEALSLAEAANRAKTSFLFNMSHDIRTPMNAILGFTSMAKKSLDNPEKLEECLDKAQQSGNLLLSLINGVLDVSRIESGRAVLAENPADVNYSFSAIEGTMKELAESRNINLSFEMSTVLNRYVYCDFDRCNRIFVNIISNAIKYTPEGGFVKVKGQQLGEAKNGFATYRYTFADNGIGMSEEFQRHVFEQFTRENATAVNGVQGTGLGLAVCKSFTELMGGTIECSSRQGEGTTFTVTLPFRLQPEDGQRYVDPETKETLEASHTSVNEISLGGKRALLVEDNEMNREIATFILEEAKIIVEEAEDGSVAVERLREKGPDYYDMVLMDIQMPVMNGYEATRAIREMYPDARLPIIAVSANAFAEDKAASIEAGMNDHIAKPINTAQLLEAMNRLV